jgi:hypothetical protein
VIAAIDLGGVLAPEIRPRLGDQFGVPELHLTTRDTGAFQDLMQRREDALDNAGPTLAEVQNVARQVQTHLGFKEFLEIFRRNGNI